jgi:predicted nucleotidyltransferase
MQATKPDALTAAERQALASVKTALKTLLGENLVSLRLFGSRARGEGTPESDLDVLVLVRTKDPALCRRIVEAALDADLAYDTNVAPTILTTTEYDLNRESAPRSIATSKPRAMCCDHRRRKTPGPESAARQARQGPSEVRT